MSKHFGGIFPIKDACPCIDSTQYWGGMRHRAEAKYHVFRAMRGELWADWRDTTSDLDNIEQDLLEEFQEEQERNEETEQTFDGE